MLIREKRLSRIARWDRGKIGRVAESLAVSSCNLSVAYLIKSHLVEAPMVVMNMRMYARAKAYGAKHDLLIEVVNARSKFSLGLLL